MHFWLYTDYFLRYNNILDLANLIIYFDIELDTTGSCSPNEFQCANRDCISSQNTVCNFVNDCADGSDETGCGKLCQVHVRSRGQLKLNLH